MSATADEAHMCAPEFASIVRRIWPRHAAKHVARIADAPYPTVKRWVTGAAEPSATKLLRMMRECDQLRAEVLRSLDEAGE